jgi:CheY-like chemotaxis protein
MPRVKKYGLIVFNPGDISDSIRSLKLDFKLTHCQSLNSLQTHASFHEDHLILIDVMADIEKQFDLLNVIRHDRRGSFDGLSVVLLVEDLSLDERLKACEIGADDCISARIEHDDLVTRLRSTIYNAIANKQLKEQLKAASDVAMAAMSNTSDMGANIQFLLDSHHCANLDQLGQLLFQSLNYFGLNCSLQMRGRYQVKNMEANGMSLPMESRLLTEMKDAGRFYDFGSRTVINYDSISLLIKNMPLDQPEKYGIIKDNIFALLQGADARLKALDLQETVNREHLQQTQLIAGLHAGIAKLETNYLDLTNDVAAVVDQIVDSVEQVMQTLLLTEEQESVLLSQLRQGRDNVIALFQGYASMDDELKALIEK